MNAAEELRKQMVAAAGHRMSELSMQSMTDTATPDRAKEAAMGLTRTGMGMLIHRMCYPHDKHGKVRQNRIMGIINDIHMSELEHLLGLLDKAAE